MKENEKYLRKIIRKIIRKQIFWHRPMAYSFLKEDVEDSYRFIEEKDILISWCIFQGMRVLLTLTVLLLLRLADISLLSVLITVVYLPLEFFLLSSIPSYIFLYKKYKNADLGNFCPKTYIENQFDPYDKHW